jgi:hypothetical protein
MGLRSCLHGAFFGLESRIEKTQFPQLTSYFVPLPATLSTQPIPPAQTQSGATRLSWHVAEHLKIM